MSNTQTRSRRLVALGASTAVVAGLLAPVLAASSASAATETVTAAQTAVTRAGATDGAGQVTLTAVTSIAGTDAASLWSVQITSGPTGTAKTYPILASTAVGGAGTVAAGATGVVNFPAGTFDVAGLYAYTAWIDKNHDGVVNFGDPVTFGTYTAGGVPTAITWDGPYSGPASTEKTGYVKITDASGRVTALRGSESIPFATSGGGSGTLNIGTATTPVTNTGTVTTATTPVFPYGYKMYMLPSNDATGTFTVLASGAGIGVANNVTTTFTVVPQVYAQTLGVSASKLNINYDGPWNIATTHTTSVRADTTSLTFTATQLPANAGSLIGFQFATISGLGTVSANGSVVTATQTVFVPVSASGTASVAVAVSAPSAGGQLVVRTATGLLTPWTTATVDWENAEFVLTATPTSGTNVVTAPGAATAVSATLSSQFGDPYTGGIVSATNTDGINTTTAVSGVSDASGKVSLSVPAPSASSTSGTITVTALGQGALPGVIVNTADNPNPATIGVYYTTVKSITVTGGSDATTTVSKYVPYCGLLGDNYGPAGGLTPICSYGMGGVSNPVANAFVATVVLNNGAVPADVAVNVAAPTGGFVDTTNAATQLWNSGDASTTLYTDGTGKVAFYGWVTKVGAQNFTASLGGVSGTGSITGITFAEAARNVAVSAPTTGAAGLFYTATVTVTDNFGNPVLGAFVDLTVTSAVGRFANGNRQTTVQTDAEGKAQVDITTSSTDAGTVTIVAGTNPNAAIGYDAYQYGAGANYLYASNSAGWTAPGFTKSTAPATINIAISGAANVRIISPSQGSAISTGGRFNVRGTATGLAEGTEVYLTLDYRAKAKTTVEAGGAINFLNIPAEAGQYRIRVGSAGSFIYSDWVSLTIKLFSITRYTPTSGKDTFQIATGNWSGGTTIYLTRNGVSTATVKVGKVGQPVAVSLNPAPGTYQVRVNSNQGPVYGDANGQVVVK